MTGAPATPISEMPPLPDSQVLAAAVNAALGRYIEARRRRIRPFIDRHFSLRGSLRLHRRAIGWDMLKAPANLALGLPHAALQLTGAGISSLGARRLGARLRRRSLLLDTAVGREIERLVQTELLELPWNGKGRDALAEEIVNDPTIGAALTRLLAPAGERIGDEAFRARLADDLARYVASRPAASELAVALISVGTGALAFERLTPGAMTLGPILAGTLAQNAAVASFPLGPTLGSLWYGMFPASVPLALTAGVTGGLMAGTAVLAAFAGVAADPLQRRLGLHERRLRRLIDALERSLAEPDGPGLALRDHYVARLADLLDVAATAWRAARG
ncbi:MAG TPA: DUF6635 family protein [Aliidongia sp.]|nr:DUF6635 family protein [Aliidongia sp.]